MIYDTNTHTHYTNSGIVSQCKQILLGRTSKRLYHVSQVRVWAHKVPPGSSPTMQDMDSWYLLPQVPDDVMAGWAAIPADTTATRYPFKQLGRLEKVSYTRKQQQHQSGHTYAHAHAHTHVHTPTTQSLLDIKEMSNRHVRSISLEIVYKQLEVTDNGVLLHPAFTHTTRLWDTHPTLKCSPYPMITI